MTIDYQARRFELCEQLSAGTVAFVSGATLVTKSGDQKFPFWQNTDFFYLTGWPEPHALLCLYKEESGLCLSILFHPENSLFEQKWHGGLLTQSQAVQDYVFDQAYTTDQLPQWLQRHQPKIHKLYCLPQDRSAPFIQKELGLEADLTMLPRHLSEKRLVKSADELELLKKACELTTAAHRATITRQAKKSFRYEYEVAAAFAYEGAIRGANGLSYDSIAAHGRNACILHYTDNTDAIDTQECILLDAGLRWGHYGADVTRVWPASGRFSSEQKLIYTIVLEAHQQAIAMLRPGVAWIDVQRRSEEILVDGLRQSGVLKAHVSDQACVQEFYGHGVGHSLGLDVHDPSPRREEWLLKENMVVTVEPGLYLGNPELLQDIRFSGIGIRIEDNIQLTTDGSFNLTESLPVDIASVEALSQGVG